MSTQSQKPTVKYHCIVEVDQNGNILPNGGKIGNKLVVNHVIQIIHNPKGDLESVLHLIGYSFFQIKQINRQLGIKYECGQKTAFQLSLFDEQIYPEIKNSRPSRAHIVVYDNRLYGVIVEEGRVRICGQINRVIPLLKEDNNELYEKGVRIDRNNSGNNWFSCDKEVRHHIENGKHIISVSEKGALLIVPNSDCIEHQLDNKILLVLGHGFAVIDDSPQIPVHFIRTKQSLRDYVIESTELANEESIVVAFAAIAIGCNDYKIYGTGSVVNIKYIKQFSDPINK